MREGGQASARQKTRGGCGTERDDIVLGTLRAAQGARRPFGGPSAESQRTHSEHAVNTQ